MEIITDDKSLYYRDASRFSLIPELLAARMLLKEVSTHTTNSSNSMLYDDKYTNTQRYMDATGKITIYF